MNLISVIKTSVPNFGFLKRPIDLQHIRGISKNSSYCMPNERNFEETNNDQEIEIEKFRNKSRLREDHRNMLMNEVPYPEAKEVYHLTVRYQRKVFGKYGLKSGVNPGISWPTKADLDTRREYEKVAFPFTIEELITSAKNEVLKRELEIQEKHDLTTANMLKLMTWKKELKEKIAKREAEALAVKEKKEKLIEDVRRHFGFKIDPRDERFKEMLAIKEKEQKKKERQAKLEEREKKAIAKLMSKNDISVPESSKPN